MSEAIDLYIAHLREEGVKEQSGKTARYRLSAMFRGAMDLMIGDLSPRRCDELYADLRTRQAADTHRNTLSLSKTFLSWCRDSGFGSRNPMDKVKGSGPRSVGKEQLTVDEARRVWKLATRMAKGGDAGALATLVILATGIRAGECAAIVDRDVDDGGRSLVIPKSKTRAGVRSLVIERWLGRLLKAEADGGEAFPGRDRYWVLYHVKRLCRLAGVQEVSPHGLRGTHASIATRGGASSEVVSRALGHTNTRITERHYTSPEATDAARSKRVSTRLAGR